MFLKRYAMGLLFLIFVFLAIAFKGAEPLFISAGPYAMGKTIIWVLFFSFLGYSIYCGANENFFRTLGRLYPMLWARQIGIDLYIGLLISGFIIYLNEGSLLILALWIFPLILFANLATLLYFAMNYDSIISHFTA